jgi:hypothetical protein
VVGTGSSGRKPAVGGSKQVVGVQKGWLGVVGGGRWPITVCVALLEPKKIVCWW